MDTHTPDSALEQSVQDRDTDWIEMTERLKALQDKYAKAREGEPRSFATRFRD